MYSERLQLLLSPEQRRRLDDEAKRTGASIASLIRDALDERYGRLPTREERMAAVERIRNSKPGPRVKLTPEDINRMHEEQLEERQRRAGLGRMS